MDNQRFQKHGRQHKGEVKRQWNPCPDTNLLKAESDYDKFFEDAHKRFGEHNDEVERWAQDWCERGGWRNNRSAHRD
jgi:uncharacterized protein YjbJ (UPF0337 family)